MSTLSRKIGAIGLKARANFGVKLSAGWCPARRPSRLRKRKLHGVTPAAHRSLRVSSSVAAAVAPHRSLAREARRSLHQGRSADDGRRCHGNGFGRRTSPSRQRLRYPARL